MKNYSDLVLSIYWGILKDATARWPELQSSFEMDYSYLTRALQSRGTSFATITLPECGKALDRSVHAWGIAPEIAWPKGFAIRKNKPVLFRALFSILWPCVDEALEPDWSADYHTEMLEAYSILRQLFYCCKNIEMPVDKSKLESTLDEFFQIERALPPSWPGTWDSDVPEWEPRIGHPLWGTIPESRSNQSRFDFGPDPDHNCLPWDTLRAIARRALSELGTVDWWNLRPKHGPGAVSDSRYGLKYEFPFWPRKLDLWFPFDWFGSGLLGDRDLPSDREPPSRLIAVPKSQKGPRLICAEPTSHQWMQQSIWRWMEGAIGRSDLLRRSIDFRSQEGQRKRALEASASWDGAATIDLSSASDRLSTRLVEYIFQGFDVLDGMHASRTRLLSQDLSDRHDRFCALRKFATMGSALTFPVQTVVFTILTVWALMVHEGTDRNPRRSVLRKAFDRVHVFGDDIIAPSDAISTIQLVLHQCGLRVNDAKTFAHGRFRESCGVDASKGVDVTPAYILQPYDASPSSIASLVEVSNNFHLKGLWNTADVVLSLIPPKERKLLRVCGGNDGNFGLKSFVGSSTSHLRGGWDEIWQRGYTVSLNVTAKVTRRRGRGSADLTQFFTEDPSDSLSDWEAGQVSGILLRKRRVRVYE